PGTTALPAGTLLWARRSVPAPPAAPAPAAGVRLLTDGSGVPARAATAGPGDEEELEEALTSAPVPES
ncbi:MAG TPA: hypothetical protein VN520_11135, partial [Streptomyces sp.]|nr:hypothetical protein [Streptomyces sp.]